MSTNSFLYSIYAYQPSQLNAFEEDKKKLAATRPKRKSADFLQREVS